MGVRKTSGMRLMASSRSTEDIVIDEGSTDWLTTGRVQALMRRLLQNGKCRQTGGGRGHERRRVGGGHVHGSKGQLDGACAW